MDRASSPVIMHKLFNASKLIDLNYYRTSTQPKNTKHHLMTCSLLPCPNSLKAKCFPQQLAKQHLQHNQHQRATSLSIPHFADMSQNTILTARTRLTSDLIIMHNEDQPYGSSTRKIMRSSPIKTGPCRARKGNIMSEAGADVKRKPKLSVEEQIKHLNSKGVTFNLCGEGNATRVSL